MDSSSESNPQNHETNVNSGGGAYVHGNASSQGNFVGRDYLKIIHNYNLPQNDRTELIEVANSLNDDSRPTGVSWNAIDPKWREQYLVLSAKRDKRFTNYLDSEEFLRNYFVSSGLAYTTQLNNTYLTQAGILLMCKWGHIPENHLHTRIHYTNNLDDISPNQDLDGCILELYTRLLDIFRTFFQFGQGSADHRDDLGAESMYYDYPENAIIEALVNFLIHRNYATDDRAFITVDPDKIEFSNPGKSLIPPEELLHADVDLRPRYNRNQRLVQAMNNTSLNQQRGSGIRRIRKELEKNQSIKQDGSLGIDIRNDDDNDRFILIIYKRIPKPVSKKQDLDTVKATAGISNGAGEIVTGELIRSDHILFTEDNAYNINGLVNPYLGLRVFTYSDRSIYAGRERLVYEVAARMTSPGAMREVLFITGASGSGKSSFAQAGLLPALESHYATFGKIVRHAVFRPSTQPMIILQDALLKLHPDFRTLEDLINFTPEYQINVLIIDQFEELFIQSNAGQRTLFCDFLSNLPSFETSRTHILITMRVDYLDELFAIQPLWSIAKEGVELRTMRADDLRNAIQKPLQVYHPQKRFAPELLDRLVQDAGEDAALLPLLQVTLAELWKTGKLVLSNYHSLTDAIRQRAEMVYAFSDHSSADPKVPRSYVDQQELMDILLDLINVSADNTDLRDARQRRTRQELEQSSTQRSRLIEELVNARLLAAASETRNAEDVEVIDIIHESLIDNWNRLQSGIEEQRQQLQRRARFKLWLGEWLRNERKDGYLLLTDVQLAEARTLAENLDIELQNEEAREFYQRSLERQLADRNARTELEVALRKQINQYRIWIIGLVLLLILSLLVSSMLLMQK